jgi:hypothetical protein
MASYNVDMTAVLGIFRWWKKRCEPRAASRLTQLVKVLVCSFALAGCLVAQPSLRITSPADGTTVHPGELLTVTVDVSPPEGAFKMVAVISTSPIESSKETLKRHPIGSRFRCLSESDQTATKLLTE